MESTAGENVCSGIHGDIREQLEALKKQYESQLDSLRQELDTERQARTENMDDTQNKEEKLEMLDTAEKETVDEVITAINTQHAMEIEQLQQKYLDDVDLKVKAMRITLEQIYTSQLDLVQTELEKKRVQSLKELHDQLTQEHEGDINRIEMLWEKRLEDLEDQHDNEMNKSLLEESLNTKESTSVQIQRALKKMAQEHEGILQKISDGLEKSPKLRTPRKKKQNQEQQTEGDETDTESIRSMPVTEEEYQQLEEKEKIVEKAEDVRRTLENQREELDQLRACLLQEYEQLLSARTQSMSVEAQEVEKLEDEMNQLHRLYKQKAKEQPGHQSSDLSNLKAQYENKISTLEKYHQEELLKFRDEVEKLRQDLSSQKRESGSDIVTSSGLPDEQDSEREYVKNTYTMTVISDDDSLPSPRGDDSGGISIQELKTLLAKREDEISDFQLKVSQDNIEIQELQFKLTEQTDKIQELENKLRINQSELDEVNSLISDKDCKIDTLMKQKQALGEKCLRELEESENKHAKIVDEINEKFAKVMSDLKISKAEVSKLKLELEASQEQERMLEEQYDDLQQQQKAAMKNFQERSEHDNEEIINELKLEHQKEIELLKEKLKEEKSEHENEEIINEMKLEHQKELESLKEKHKDDLDSLSEKHIGDLEKLKEELENSYKEQIEELEYQHKLKIDSLTEDLEHENEVENETLKTELNVQMEVELKRQAADIAAQHEIEMKNLREEYEQKIQEIQSERVIEEKQQKSVSELVMSDIVEEKMEKTFSPREMTAKTTGEVQEEMVEEKLEKTFSPREDDSDTHSQDTVIEVSKSEDTVIDARNKSEAEIDKTEADGDSLEEDKDTKDNTLSESLLQTDQSQDFDQIDSSHDFDQTASSRDFTQTASTLDSATSSDSSEKELPPIPQGHDNTIAVLMQEIARAKEETVKQLQAEYHIEIADLNKQLDEAMEKNAKLEESYKEELEKLKESYESKIKEMEESIPVQEDSVAELKQEYEGKLDQLNEKLKEAIDKNNELENTLKKEELDRLVEKYESRIKEMEELAAEKEETVKKLKDELEEEMAQLKEKLEETNESKNSDKEELSKIKENYEARIKELEERDISSKEEAEELTLLKEKLEEATEKYSELEENYKKEMEETVEKYEAKIKELEESNSTFKEEIEEINSLKQNLEEVTEKNSKLEEEFKEEKDKLIEQYEARIKELEESEATTKEEIEKQNLAKQKLIKEHDGEVSKLNREYEEKMDLLRQELMETFETEKEDLKKQHEADLNDAEEKYDTLIDRIKSGEAPEVADIIHERYDTELEMAKSLMQQEFDETLESEQARFMEQHQELMDKFIEERQAEAEELRMQHEKDIAECRKTIIEEYDAKIVELEQNQDLEIHRLKEEMAKIIPGIEAGDAAQEDKSIEEETEEQSLKIEQEVNQGNVELPSDPDIAKRRSSASKDDSIEDLRETHTAIIARIEAEYEEKLKKIKEEMASTHSTHSDDVDGASVDTIVSKKSGDQHKQELLSLEQHLSEKHKKEIQNLQTQHQNRIDDMENKYKQEIGNLKKILEFLQHSSSSEDTIHAQLASPAQTVPTLEGLEEEIVPEVSGRYVPSRSTPRDDMESVDRVEVTEKVKRPKQISPRDKKEIITEESSDESIKEEIDEESESEISEEPILPSSAPPRQLSASANFDFDAGLDVKTELEEEEDLDRTVSYDKDDSFQSGRSTPPDLLQTRALGDTLAGLKTVSTYESGDLPVSYEVVKQKDAKIKELEEEVQKLTHRLQDQIEEERLILMRRERESQEGQNLELMLKSDLERVNDDRESVQRTNEQLLQLLSDSVKTYLNVEDSINKKLAKMVAEGDKSGGSKGKSSPKQERSQPVGAEGGDGDGESLQETSILSNVTDEGLDLSQRISESIFQGPELDKDGEELLKDASHRLQNSVSRLLEMIEETTNQLYEARTTQHELVDHVNIHEQDSNQMNSQVQELQEQLREEIRAKEYLAVELHKAEGLIEGYSSEREALNQQISELEEKKEALVLELETTKNKLQDLESVHHEAVSLRAELQRQQAIMQNNVGEEAQVTLTTAEGTPPRAEALLLELNRLNDEKRDLQQQVRDLQEKYEGRVRDLQCAGEETERHYLTILEEKKTEIVDLQLQVDATEKQLKANKQFLEEQAIEREQELEEYQREVNKWKQEAQNKNKMNKSENRLQKEVDDLTEELQDRMNSHSAIVQQTAKLQQDLREKKLTTEELNILVRQLELEIEDKNIIEKQLKLKIASLEEELEKQFSEDSGTESPAPEEDVASSGEGSRQTRGHRRRRLLPSNVSVKQEEALIHEKEALQNQVEEQMKQISALKNQLDEMRQRGDYGEETQAATLQRKLEREKDLLEEKEQKVAELQVQIEDMEEQLSKKEQHIQQLTSQGKRVPVEEITSQYDDRVTQLERENLELVGKVKSLQDQSPTELPPFSQTLLDEKNQEIDHLSDQVHQLQEELDKLNSGEDIVNLRDEVERLRGELDKRNFDFIRASHTSDGSFTDSEMPGVSASFAEKTSLQQEIEDSVANQIDQINGLQQEVEQLKSSLTQREDEITALKTELESKPTKTEDLGYLNDVLQEKEALIDQLNIQLEGLNHEVESLTDFQNKLQEDFDMVQAMLEEKEKEIDMLTHELTQKPSNDESVVKLELEIAKMSRDLAEKDNVIDEKAEEMYMLNEKLEQQEGTLLEMEELKMKVVELERETEKLSSIKSSGDETQKLLAEKEAQLHEKETEISQKEAEMSKMKEELDTVNEHLSIAENLQRKLEEAGMLGPNILLRDKDEEIQKLKNDLQELKQKLDTYAESDEQLLKNKDEIAKLKQELAALRIQVRDDRTEELRISHEEIGALRQRLKTADNQEGINILTEEINKLRKNMRPEDIATVIREKDEKLDALKCQSALLQHQLNMAYSKEEMEEKEDLIQSLQMELAVLKHSADQDLKTKEVEAEAGQMIQPQVVADNQQLMFAVNTQAPMRLVQEEEVTAELASDVQGVPQTAKAQLEARDLEIGRLREELAYFKDSYGSSSPGKDETISDLEANLEIKEDMLRSKEEVIEQLKLDLENVQQSFLEAKNEEESAMQAKSEEIQVLQSQLVSFESKIDEYAHLKDRLDQYESDLSQKDDMLQDLEDECTELRKKLKDRENKMQQELQKAASFEAGDDLFAQLQEKQEKLEQTSKELSNTFSKLKETEGKLEQMGDVKQRLKEAVELSEQQLHIVEQKDQEFMKLKLEICELISEKDQVIKDLKQEVQQIAESKIKELDFLNQQAEQDKTDNLQVIEQLQHQVRQLQSDSGGAGDAVSSVNKLQVQLQENENIMMEMHTELEATRAKLRDTALQLDSKVTELEEVRGQVSNDRVRTEAAAQGQLDELRQELHIAKTALDEMQREGGWRNSRETSVDREPRKELFDSDDELEIMDRQELMKEIKELRRDLKTALSELDLFRSTVSMSAKDYVRKVMELREELSQQHQKHIQAMQDRTRTDAETNLAQLRIRYEDEIDHLKKLHRTEIEKKIGEVRREMEKAHNQEMERVMMAHQQEMEMARLQEPGLSDTMTMEAGRRLQSEISLSEKLDNRLLNSLQRQPEGASANDTTDVSGVSSTENIQDENMSAKLQMLMNRLHREGVQMLSISELQFLNRHMSPTQIDKEVDVESLRTSWESEKQSLLSAIQSLKDLLAQTHKLRGLEKGPDVSDWRGELLQAISFVFAKERDTLLAELRSHVLSHPAEDLSDIQKLEQKIRNQEEHQKSSLDQIFKADRQSMLAEIRDLRAHTNISLMKHQEEREKMSEQLSSIEDQTTKKERQAKRQVQLLEYKLQQEKILLDDIRSRYDMECERNSELSTLLSREKNGNLDYQTEISNQQVQISKLKEALEREQSRFVSVSEMWDSLVGALDEEKGKSHYLSELLEAERIKFNNIQVQLDDIRVHTETQQRESIVEQLQKELMKEREKRLHADNTYELDQMTISTLKQELDKEQKNFHNMVTEYEGKLQQMATTIDMEKARCTDLEREIEREKYMNQRLRNNLEEERDTLHESTDREKGMLDEIQMELETEKEKNLDLQRSLDREKKRSSDLMKSVDDEKSGLREELDNERQACRQLKNELDQVQLQKLDITRHYEHERDQLNRLKVERDQLRNDMRALRERENERERQRDNDKITDKRTNRQLEREKDDFKMKLHEADLEMQRLKQKILDLEEQVTISREKEMDVIRELEQEKLRTLHNKSLERELLIGNEGSPRSEMETVDQKENWKVYKAQLESLCQSLQYQMLQFQDKIGHLTRPEDEDAADIQNSVKDLLNELRHVQIPLTFETGADRNLMSRPDLNAVNGRVLHHNNELTNFVSRLTEEKIELRKALGKLEEEVWRYRQRETPIKNGDLNSSHLSDKHLEDKADWAKERLSLQLALNNSERQIEQLQHDLKIERDRRSTLPNSGVLSDYDKDKMQRLYGKYLRAESYRKALIYQKKYLLLLLGGFQDCEQTTLALIARMGAFPSPQDMQPRTSHTRLFTVFRSAARVVVAVCRMKFLVNKWKRAARVGSPVVSGTVDTQQGYMPTNKSYSPHARSSSSPYTSVNGLYHMSPHLSTASLRFRTTSSPHPTPLAQLQMYGSSAVSHDYDQHQPSPYTLNGRASPYSTANGSALGMNGTSLGMNGSSQEFRSSPSVQTSGARRKLISTPTSSPSVKRESPQTQRRVRISDNQTSVHDSYIQRLENLQMKLGSIDSGDEGDISSTEIYNLPEENLLGDSPNLSSISSDSSEYYPM